MADYPIESALVDPDPAAVIAELLEAATAKRAKAGEALQRVQAEYDKHNRSVVAFTAARRAIEQQAPRTAPVHPSGVNRPVSSRPASVGVLVDAGSPDEARRITAELQRIAANDAMSVR